MAEYAVETLSLIPGSGTLLSVDDFDFGVRPCLGLNGVGGGCIVFSGCAVSSSGEPAVTRLRGFSGRRCGCVLNIIIGICFKDSGIS